MATALDWNGYARSLGLADKFALWKSIDCFEGGYFSCGVPPAATKVAMMLQSKSLPVPKELQQYLSDFVNDKGSFAPAGSGISKYLPVALAAAAAWFFL